MMIPVLALLYSCTVLTESQVKNINAFAQTAKAYSDFPSIPVKKAIEFHIDNELLAASQFRNADTILHRIESARKFERATNQLADKFDLSLKLIQQYSSLLTKLSSDQFSKDLAASTKDLGENLTDLITTYNSKVDRKIPASVGSALSSAILIVGKRLVARKQTQELKKFVLAGSDLIKPTLANLIEVLDADTFTDKDGNRHGTVKAFIEGEKSNFIRNFQNVIFKKGPVDPNAVPVPEFTADRQIRNQSIAIYYARLDDFEKLEQLRQKTVSSARNFEKAHNALVSNTREKKQLSDIISETQSFIKDAQELFKLLKSITKENKD